MFSGIRKRALLPALACGALLGPGAGCSESSKNGEAIGRPDATSPDGGGGKFPVHDGNVFSIQYRNSTNDAITIWLIGTKPPCNKAQATNCRVTGDSTEWAAAWDRLHSDNVFKNSGTQFFRVRANGQSEPIAVSTHVDLEKGELLRIVPPVVDGIPEWYWSNDGKTPVTSGTTTWATRRGLSMPAPGPVLVFEYNLSASLDAQVWFNLSTVEGLNGNATMTLEGPGCKTGQCGCDQPLPKHCMTNVDRYDGTNDGCPYSTALSGVTVCPNPKGYPGTLDPLVTKPSWVVSSSQFTTDDVQSKYNAIWQAAGSPDGLTMASAPSGDSDKKKAYHIWWSTNPVGQGWLRYLQKNAKGSCDAYGWAYDEKRWREGDSFDSHGNPPDNREIGALVSCPNTKDTYINIDILKLM